MPIFQISGLIGFDRYQEVSRSVPVMSLNRKNGLEQQLPTQTTTTRSAWRRDLASRLGMSVAEVEASINGLLLENSQPDSVRKFRDANGAVTTLVRFPAGWRPATHVEPTN